MKTYTVIYNNILKQCSSIQEVGVITSLCTFMHGEREHCWAGIEEIAKRAKTSERTVNRCLFKLKKKGILSVKRRPNNTSIYTILDISETPEWRTGNDREGISETPEWRTNKTIEENNRRKQSMYMDAQNFSNSQTPFPKGLAKQKTEEGFSANAENFKISAAEKKLEWKQEGSAMVATMNPKREKEQNMDRHEGARRRVEKYRKEANENCFALATEWSQRSGQRSSPSDEREASKLIARYGFKEAIGAVNNYFEVLDDSESWYDRPFTSFYNFIQRGFPRFRPAMFEKKYYYDGKKNKKDAPLPGQAGYKYRIPTAQEKAAQIKRITGE